MTRTLSKITAVSAIAAFGTLISLSSNISVAAASLTSTSDQPTSQSSFVGASPAGVRSIAQASPSFQMLEQSVHAQINQYRKSKGLPPLTLDPRISRQALGHSQAMASGRVPFSHNGFQQRVQAIASLIPYSGAAENVAYNMGYRDPATQAVQGWLKSPGHRKNIEGRYDLTGVGIAQNAKGEMYFTQIFIKSKR